jgi:hypothetical protein
VVITPGSGTTAAAGRDGVHLTVATYPDPERGIGTAGGPISGWTVSAQLPGQVPAREVVYDAPVNDRFLPMVDAVIRYLPLT